MKTGRQQLGEEVKKEEHKEKTAKQETVKKTEKVCENIETYNGAGKASLTRLGPCQHKGEQVMDNSPSLPGSFCGFLMVVLVLWIVLENSVDPELE